MLKEFLELNFDNIGQFKLRNKVLDFECIDVDYNPSNIIWAVLTDKETLYIGETINSMNDVLKDLAEGNRNRNTRNDIHLLVAEYIEKDNVYFLVDRGSFNSKKQLIKKFKPVGNKNGKSGI